MKRIDFIKTTLASSIITAMNGLSSLASTLPNHHAGNISTNEFTSFGAVHLNNTNLSKAINFWTKIAGMKLRFATAEFAELGTEANTLVVVHQTAKHAFQQGYSGLYHFAIHAPNPAEFAKMVYRLLVNNYPFSLIDHTMSKSVYLEDADGINIEFALETPQRFKKVITDGGLRIEDANNIIRPASYTLDLDEVMKDLLDKALEKNISNATKIGHIHLYATDVTQLNSFYKQLGFIQFNNLPQFLYADVGAGGTYQHRIAMNAWHGINRPLAPVDNAGLKHYQIHFKTNDALILALSKIPHKEVDGAYWTTDPTGNSILLTS